MVWLLRHQGVCLILLVVRSYRNLNARPQSTTEYPEDLCTKSKPTRLKQFGRAEFAKVYKKRIALKLRFNLSAAFAPNFAASALKIGA